MSILRLKLNEEYLEEVILEKYFREMIGYLSIRNT